jgi:hypothetical protein
MTRLYLLLNKAGAAYILRRTTARRMLSLLLALLVALTAVGQASAFQEVDRVLGPVTLARSQNARLSVTNLGTQAGSGDPSIRVVLVFYDSRGRTLAQSETRLAPGETARHDLRGASLPRDLGDSVPVTGLVRVLASDPAIGNPNIKTTLEVFAT